MLRKRRAKWPWVVGGIAVAFVVGFVLLAAAGARLPKNAYCPYCGEVFRIPVIDNHSKVFRYYSCPDCGVSFSAETWYALYDGLQRDKKDSKQRSPRK